MKVSRSGAVNRLCGSRSVLIALGACAVTMAAMPSRDASAAYKRVHSSVCHSKFQNNGGTTTVGTGSRQVKTGNVQNGFELKIFEPGGRHEIFCPAPSDTNLAHGSTTTLNVHGWQPGGGVAAVNTSQACVRQYDGDSTSCGPTKSWGAGYAGVYGVSTISWTTYPTHMPYVVNMMSGTTRLFGFYMSN